MSDARPPGYERRKTRRSDPKDLTDAVQAVMDSKRQEAAELRASRAEARRREKRQTPMVVTLAVTASLLAWMWIAKPDAIFGGPRVAQLSPARAEAQARYALYLERARIDAYRQAHGRLPAQLADAGPVEDGVRYTVSGRGFVLERAVGNQTFTLNHATHPDSFLGESLEILRHSP